MRLLRRREAAPGTMHDGIEYTSRVVLPAEERSSRKGRKKSLSRGYSRFRYVRRRLSNAVIAFALMMVAVFGVAAPAQATWYEGFAEIFCPSNTDYAKAETDPVGVLYMHDTANFNSEPRTAYEKYGMSGANFSYFYGEKDAEEGSPLAREGGCFRFDTRGYAAASNSLFSFTKMVIGGTSFVYGSAFGIGDTLEEQFLPLIENVTKSLKDNFYLQLITVVLMIAAIWLAYIGIVKRAYTRWLIDLISIVVVMLIGFALMAQPQHLPNFMMNAVNTANGTIQASIAGVAPDAGSSDAVCWLPPSLGSGSNSGSGGALSGTSARAPSTSSMSERNVRMMQCNLWQVFVLFPYTHGQFGVAYGDPILSTPEHEVTIGDRRVAGNFALRQIDAQSLDNSLQGEKGDAVEAKGRAWIQVRNEVAETPLISTWRGESNTLRTTMAFLSLVGAVAGGFLIAWLSIAMLVYKFRFFAMLLFLPVMLLVGLHPSWGKRQLMQYFASLASLVLKMIMSSAMIGVMVLIFHTTLHSAGEGEAGFAISALTMIIVSIGGFMMRKNFIDNLSNVTVGGQSGMQIQAPPALKQTGSILAGGAAGLAGGVGGAAAAMKAGGGLGAATRVMAKSTVRGAQRGAYTSGATRGAFVGYTGGLDEGRAEAAQQRSKAQERSDAKQRAADEAAREADPATYAAQEREMDKRIREARLYEDDPTFIRLHEQQYNETPTDFLARYPKTSDERRDDRRREEVREYLAKKDDPDYMAHLKAKYGGRLPTYLTDASMRKRYETRPQDKEEPTSKGKPGSKDAPGSADTADATQPKPSNFTPKGSARPYRESTESHSTSSHRAGEAGRRPSMPKPGAPRRGGFPPRTQG